MLEIRESENCDEEICKVIHDSSLNEKHDCNDFTINSINVNCANNMQKKKDVDNDVVKIKLFLFSLRDSAKIWFSALPRNNIDSWNKCKDAFITKYFLPAKIISLRTQIMNFKRLEHEHVAQSWEIMKLMLRNCPNHGLNLWMIINFLCGIEFCL